MWRPKNPKSVSIIKLALWSGLVVWMVFFFVFGLVGAQELARGGPFLFGTSTWGQILTWVTPIWVVFTSLLLIVYIARFASRKLGRKKGE